MATNFEQNECGILVQSTKIGTNENKAINSIKVKANVIMKYMSSRSIHIQSIESLLF